MTRSAYSPTFGELDFSHFWVKEVGCARHHSA
jgi:hypothetical protein